MAARAPATDDDAGLRDHLFEKARDWESFAVTDGRLIAGQNPASSTAGAQALLKLLAEMRPPERGSSAA